jgi:predicted  nucleic acid-binding Zn-ribbon protein
MKGIMQTQGIGNIKSIHSIGARSIPKVQRSSYLDLYMLEREKDRLEKEIHTLNKRRSTAKRQLDSINKRIENLRKETHEKEKIKTYRSVPTKPLRTMAINY